MLTQIQLQLVTASGKATKNVWVCIKCYCFTLEATPAFRIRVEDKLRSQQRRACFAISSQRNNHV